MSTLATDPLLNGFNDPYDPKCNAGPSYNSPGYQIPPHISLSKMDRWEIGLVQLEKLFNTLGYIPLVSTFFSAGLRITLGLIEIISGIANGIFCVFEEIFNQSKEPFPTRRVFALTLHGVANIARAVIELVPIIGNLTCLLYDKAVNSRMKYLIEDRIAIRA